jgi:hypothetical protein
MWKEEEHGQSSQPESHPRRCRQAWIRWPSAAFCVSCSPTLSKQPRAPCSSGRAGCVKAQGTRGCSITRHPRGYPTWAV